MIQALLHASAHMLCNSYDTTLQDPKTFPVGIHLMAIPFQEEATLWYDLAVSVQTFKDSRETHCFSTCSFSKTSQ